MLRKRHFMLLLPLVVVFSFGMDTYVPFIVEITGEFHTSSQLIQLTLSSYLFALAAGQLIVGILADIYGRKAVLIYSGVIFALLSILCVFANSVETLIFFRFLQGLGVCGLRSAAYAIVKDHYDGDEAASKLTMLYSAVSLSPIVAPLIGGLVGNIWGWRAVFVLLAALGVLCIFCAKQVNDIYQRPKKGAKLPFGFREIVQVMTNTQVLIFGLMSGAAISCMSSFVSSVAYIVADTYTLPHAYIYISFCVVGVFMLCAGQLSGWTILRFGRNRVFMIAFFGIIILLCLLGMMNHYHWMNYYTYIIFISLILGLAVILNGCALGLGLDGRTQLVGLAIAVIGIFGYGVAAFGGWLLSILGVTIENYVLILLTYFLLVAVVWKIWQRRQKNPR